MTPSGSDLCLFGGAFDPPHRSHQRLAEAVPEQLDVDLVVLPSGDHPHKRADSMSASAADRLAMCRAAFEHLPRVRVDDREIRRAGRSYSLDTIRSFREELSQDATIYWLIGSDNLLGLPTWHGHHDMLAEAQLVTFPRAGFPIHDRDFEGLDFTAAERESLLAHLLPGQPDNRNATAIREALANPDCSPFAIEALPVAVARYIATRLLYRSARQPRG